MDRTADNLPAADSDGYEMLGEVARGGVGRIIRARDRRLNRLVAIKRLREPAKGSGRFMREALLTARLQHPGIIPVHEVGRFPSGEPFFAMKLVEGASLREAIARRRTLEQRLELLPNVLAVAEAIAYAHNQGVIHRDLKPSNVLVGAFGETVVIDWGLAKDLRSNDDAPSEAPVTSEFGAADETKSGVVLGTPAYMPPEQAQGIAVNERADVYALGALLYHLISGDPPFGGKNAAEIVRRSGEQRPIPLCDVIRGVPVDLCAIVNRSMAHDPTDRYADARAFAEDLRRFQVGQAAVLNAKTESFDAQLDAEFESEARTRSLRPVRTICSLALTLNPLFCLSERHILPHRQPSMLLVRGAAEILVALLFASSWTPIGRRLSREIGLSVLMLLAAMIIVLNRLQDGQLQVGFTGSFMMIFLAYLMFPYVRSWKVVAALSLSTALDLAVSTTSHTMTRAIVEQQTTLFICGIVLTTLSVRLSDRLQRAEFYSRRRLEQANRRLARFESSGAVTGR